jgi:hypothetical protein
MRRSGIAAFTAFAIAMSGTGNTQPGARTGAVDSGAGRVYLPAARFMPPAAPGERPRMVPGSFEILVIGR